MQSRENDMQSQFCDMQGCSNGMLSRENDMQSQFYNMQGCSNDMQSQKNDMQGWTNDVQKQFCAMQDKFFLELRGGFGYFRCTCLPSIRI